MKRFCIMTVACCLLFVACGKNADVSSALPSTELPLIERSSYEEDPAQMNSPAFVAYDVERQAYRLVLTAEYQGEASTVSIAVDGEDTVFTIKLQDKQFMYVLEQDAQFLGSLLESQYESLFAFEDHMITEDIENPFCYRLEVWDQDGTFYAFDALLDDYDDIQKFRPYKTVTNAVYRALENDRTDKIIALGTHPQSTLLSVEHNFGNGGATDVNCQVKNQDGVYTFTSVYSAFGEEGEGQAVVLTNTQEETLLGCLYLPGEQLQEQCPRLPIPGALREDPGTGFSNFSAQYEDDPFNAQVFIDRDSMKELMWELLKQSYTEKDLEMF